MDYQRANQLAYSMNGLGAMEWTAQNTIDATTAVANGAAAIINATKGNTNTSNNGTTNPNIIYLPTSDTSTVTQQQDNTPLYFALAAVMAMAVMFAFNKK